MASALKAALWCRRRRRPILATSTQVSMRPPICYVDTYALIPQRGSEGEFASRLRCRSICAAGVRRVFRGRCPIWTTMSCTSGSIRARGAAAHYPTPDFESIQRELATKGVTRMLLWREYKERHPDGCQYSAFAPSAATTRPGWVGRTRSCASSMCRAIRQSADGAAACVVTASGKQ